jgi:hypothetical protein
LPEKKDELGVLAVFFFSSSSWANLLFLDGMFAYLRLHVCHKNEKS